MSSSRGGTLTAMTTKEAPEAAEIALAMSECMNLLFLFAAPRVLASVRGSGMGGLDSAAALASLRRFLRHASGIRGRAVSAGGAAGVSGDVERLVQAAMIVEEIAGALASMGTPAPSKSPGTTRFEDPLPAPVVDRARRALSILGVSEPRGGWDPFEGFTVPYPPPSPQR
jgi:hypothetical protein